MAPLLEVEYGIFFLKFRVITTKVTLLYSIKEFTIMSASFYQIALTIPYESWYQISMPNIWIFRQNLKFYGVKPLLKAYPSPYSDNGWHNSHKKCDTNKCICSFLTNDMELGLIRTRNASVPANTRNSVMQNVFSSTIPVLNIYAPLAYQNSMNIFNLNRSGDCTHLNVDANIFLNVALIFSLTNGLEPLNHSWI